MSTGSTYHKFNLNIGNTIGLISVDYDTNPGGFNPLAVPIRLKITWGNLTFDSGFAGDASFNTDLLAKGYTAVTGGAVGTVGFIKNSSNPTYATLEIFSPLNNSKVAFNVVCPGPTPTPTPTSTPVGTPGPTGLPQTPAPTPTPGPTLGCIPVGDPSGLCPPGPGRDWPPIVPGIS